MGIKPGEITNARIFMLENPDAELTTEETQDGSLKVKNSLTKRYGIKTIPSKNYLTINLAEPGKKHNLFTHLISKILRSQKIKKNEIFRIYNNKRKKITWKQKQEN